MALMYSSMLELGSTIPNFKLLNAIDGALYSSDELNNEKPSLLMVICNHCPYVIHYHEALQLLTNDCGTQINMVAISSNDVDKYPQDGPEGMKALYESLQFDFPYLFDETQELSLIHI